MNIWSKMVCRLMHLAWGNKLNTNISFLCESAANAKMICTLALECSVAHTFHWETHGIWQKVTRNTRNSVKISLLWLSSSKMNGVLSSSSSLEKIYLSKWEWTIWKWLFFTVNRKLMWNQMRFIIKSDLST